MKILNYLLITLASIKTSESETFNNLASLQSIEGCKFQSSGDAVTSELKNEDNSILENEDTCNQYCFPTCGIIVMSCDALCNILAAIAR